MPRAESLADEEVLSRSAAVLARRFVQRWDVYPRQLDDGRYICIHEPLGTSHLLAHLRGEITLGTYLLDGESQARFVVLDADDEAGWHGLLEMAKRLSGEAIPSYLERSRRGGHLWFFLAQPISSREARAFGRGVLAGCGLGGIEVYPRQDQLESGPGSLIRLPFGVHRLSGRRYGFVWPDSTPLAPILREQITALANPAPVPEAGFEAYQSVTVGLLNRESVLGALPTQKPDLGAQAVATATVSERIKASVGVREFVGEYVLLSPSGVGLCPFHDDHHPSFAVDDEENYWHCFACGVGGSVIDFWMRWRDCDFTTAVSELARAFL